MAGKGDKPRPYDKTKFDKNYSQINWSSPALKNSNRETKPPVKKNGKTKKSR